MENKKNKTIVAGSMIAGALLSLSLNTNANTLFNYNALGNGMEVRNAIELSCGEKKADDKKADEKKADDKAADDKTVTDPAATDKSGS